jgi:flagellar protein FlgJ
MAYTNDDQIEFAASLYCSALMYADQTGCSWELIIAQAIQETGWGEKCLPGSNNIFNIKADPGWSGPKKRYHVREVIDGKVVWVDDEFRVYPSYAKSLEDRMRFLEKNQRYRDLQKPGIKGDYEKEARQLVVSKYATDPNYADVLIKIIRGPTFRKAVARARTRGCGPLLPALDILVLDGAKVPIPEAKIEVQLDGRKAEAVTDGNGRLVVRHKPQCGDLHLKVFDRVRNKWVELEPLACPPPDKEQSVTLIAPDFTARTSTREHEKTSPPKPALKPTPEPAPAAQPAGSGTRPHAGAAAPKFRTHKVERGQSLAKIAARYGVRYQAIAKANGITSPFIIRPDQILKIPDVEATAATQEKRQSTAAANDGGGMSLAALGQMLTEGRNYLHTLYLRNAQAHPQTDLMHASRAPWMVPAQEEFEKGVRRRPGRDRNDPRILEYFKATPALDRHAAAVDETAYCAAFANWCLGRAGLKGTGSALALSFKKWGRQTRDNRPALGAVALVKLESGSYHVTFVAGISRDGKRIATLGGNQGNAHEVSHSYCPKSWVVTYRYPTDYPDFDDDYVLHDVASDHAPMTAAATH